MTWMTSPMRHPRDTTSPDSYTSVPVPVPTPVPTQSQTQTPDQFPPSLRMVPVLIRTQHHDVFQVKHMCYQNTGRRPHWDRNPNVTLPPSVAQDPDSPFVR